MKTHKLQVGLTLIDMVIAVAIIAALASIVITALVRIDSRVKEDLCEGTLETLNAALRQYTDYKWRCNIDDTLNANEIEFYRALEFPPDCNDYTTIEMEATFDDLFSPPVLTIITVTNPGAHLDEYSGCEVMYSFLCKIPDCRQTVGQIDESLLTNKDDNGNPMTIGIDGREYSLIRIVDPWGTPLRYDYYSNEKEDASLTFNQRGQTIRNFPLITSAGPDGEFGTDDDITNRDKTKAAEYTP